MIYDVLEMSIIDKHEIYTDTLLSLILPTVLWNYIPIFIVLHMHYKNVASINRILKIILFKKQ